MGKTRCAASTTSNIQLRVGMQTTTANWDIHPTFVSTLRACPDKAHLQQSPIFGSPPPRHHTNPQWTEGDNKDIQMNIRLEVPKMDRDNQNNFQIRSVEEHTHKGCDHKDITTLSNCLGGIRLQPIIVCENVDDSENDLDSTRTQGGNHRRSLSVPPVDVTDEKKRPPMTNNASH